MRLFFTALLLTAVSLLPAQTYKVAHYTETSGYNHGTWDESLAMFQSFSYPGFTITVDQHSGSGFMDTPEVLNSYDVVVFSNTSGSNIMTATQRANFEQYIYQGGGYLGIHAASDTYRHSTANGGSTGTWDWYAENASGATVQQGPNHTSQNHNNTMTHQVPAHPSLANVPSPWNKTEEYYYWENGYLAPGFTELLRVGTTGSNSYDAPRMMAHCKEYPNGSRVFYTALGHDKDNFTSDPNFQNLIKDALEWVISPSIQSAGPSISGSLEKWDKLKIEYTSDLDYDEDDWDTFIALRFDMYFTSPSGKTYRVPGHFAADGDAGNTGAGIGNVWRCYFTPDEEGTWTYASSFREGFGITVDTSATIGTPIDFDADSGSFVITACTAGGPRCEGRLEYIDEVYRKRRDGDYYIKSGADAPENFLAYFAFDQTLDDGGSANDLETTNQYAPGFNYNGDGLHHYEIHQQHWNPGDPLINGDKGIIGALNYLASEQMTCYSGLLWNIGGDGDDVWPFRNDNNKTEFDVSKLDQWETVFWHGSDLGLEFHAKLFEQENDQDMTTVEWQSYFREMVSRFGHCLAWTWNLGEENSMSSAHVAEQAEYLKWQDPYDHNRVVHTLPTDAARTAVWGPHLGDPDILTGVSIQDGPNDLEDIIDDWRLQSDLSGHQWVIAWDEQNGQNNGVSPDNGYYQNTFNNHLTMRRAMNAALMQQAEGSLCYFGYSLVHNDLDMEDFASRDTLWDYMRYAKSAVYQVPFWQMHYSPGAGQSNDNGVMTDTTAWWIIYCEDGDEVNIDLPTGNYETWVISAYDSTFSSKIDTLIAGGMSNFQLPPSPQVSGTWPGQNDRNDYFRIIYKKDNIGAFPVENIQAGYSPRNGICWQALGEGLNLIHFQHYDPLSGLWMTDVTTTEMAGCYMPTLCGSHDVRVYSEGSWGSIYWNSTVNFTTDSQLPTGRILLGCDVPPNIPCTVYLLETGAEVWNGYTQEENGVAYIPYVEMKGKFLYMIGEGNTWTIEHN